MFVAVAGLVICYCMLVGLDHGQVEVHWEQVMVNEQRELDEESQQHRGGGGGGYRK